MGHKPNARLMATAQASASSSEPTPAPMPAPTPAPLAAPASDYMTVWVHHTGVAAVQNRTGWVQLLKAQGAALIAAGHAVDPYKGTLPYIGPPPPAPAPSPSPSPPAPAPMAATA